MADHIGGMHSTSTAVKVLDSDTTPLDQLTIRVKCASTATIVYFGGSDVTSTPANAHGYLKDLGPAGSGDSYTWGPFSHGYVKPNEIYVIGTASADIVFWEGTYK